MKHLAWGLGLLAALLALCLLSTARLTARSWQTEVLLQQAYASAVRGDMDGAKDLSDRARHSWEEAIPFIDAVTSHEETDELSRGFAELAAYAGIGQREEFLALCARLIAQSAHLRQMERACWYNILTAELFAAPLFFLLPGFTSPKNSCNI